MVVSQEALHCLRVHGTVGPADLDLDLLRRVLQRPAEEPDPEPRPGAACRAPTVEPPPQPSCCGAAPSLAAHGGVHA